MGNAAYRGAIKPEQITRMAIIPAGEIPMIVMTEFDPTITILNFKYMKDKYINLQLKFINDYQIYQKI